MLVSGGPAGGTDTPAPRSPSTPMPGQVFEFDKVAPGELMVGAFDLEARKPFIGLPIKLEVLSPDGEKTVQTKTSDTDGKVIFDGMDALPEGTKLTAEAKLGDDGPVQRSQTFEPLPGKGMGVVLTKGRMPTTPPPGAGQPQQRRRLPGPRMVPSMPQGTVRVRVVDGFDRGVPDQPVTVVMRDASQTETTFEGVTDATGVAMISDVTVRSDSFYNVRVAYDQGPYRSGFFQMDKSGGIAVDVRVFETTDDHGAVQAALQYEVHGAENDEAVVYRIYEVIVRGDKAFWPPGGMEIHASEDAKGLTVLPPAEPWLDHEGAAPFAALSRPIPPNEPVHLSIAWMQEHDGDLEIDWQPPFSLIRAGVIVDKEQTLVATGMKKSDRDPPDEKVELWELPTGGGPVQFSVEELPIRNPVFRRLGLIFGILLATAAAAAVALTPRRTAVQRLLVRRKELMKLLRGATGDRHERIVAALDRVYRQLDALGWDRDKSVALDATRPPRGALVAAAVLWLAAVTNLVLLVFTGSSQEAGTVLLSGVGVVTLACASILLPRMHKWALVPLYVFAALLAVRIKVTLSRMSGTILDNSDELISLGIGVAIFVMILRYARQLHKNGQLD